MRQRRVAAWLLVGALVVAGGVVTATTLFGHIGQSSKARSSSSPTKMTAGKPDARKLAVTHSSSATVLGATGMQAAWVRQENARSGTTAWEIPPARASGIEGFADRVYAGVGDSVRLYVSTAAARFRVDAYRIGYYQGTGARLVWQSATVAGAQQPPCVHKPLVNMVSCENWSVSLSVPITDAFVPGDYLLKLVGGGDQQSYVPLTVWDPASHAAYVIKNDVYTWQAWNTYGGYDFYAGRGSCSANVYPICSRARIVSFDRPYAIGLGAGDFLGNEYPLVRFAEQQSLDVTYATDVTLEQHPDYLLSHRAMLSLGHDEAWSLPERRAAVAAEAHGVNLAFFAASPMLRHVRLEASSLGPDRQEVDYRNSSEDPLNHEPKHALDVTGNTWASPPASWPEDLFVGATYAGYVEPDAPPADFVVADGGAWIFRGTGLHTGSVVPGLLRSDFDEYNSEAHPADEQVFAHSPIPLRDAQSTIGASRGRVFSDMTYYTDPRSGAGVFDSGTNNWIPALNDCGNTAGCPAKVVRAITANLLRVLGQAPAGTVHRSVPNGHDLYQAGG